MGHKPQLHNQSVGGGWLLLPVIVVSTVMTAVTYHCRLTIRHLPEPSKIKKTIPIGTSNNITLCFSQYNRKIDHYNNLFIKSHFIEDIQTHMIKLTKVCTCIVIINKMFRNHEIHTSHCADLGDKNHTHLTFQEEGCISCSFPYHTKPQTVIIHWYKTKNSPVDRLADSYIMIITVQLYRPYIQ